MQEFNELDELYDELTKRLYDFLKYFCDDYSIKSDYIFLSFVYKENIKIIIMSLYYRRFKMSNFKLKLKNFLPLLAPSEDIKIAYNNVIIFEGMCYERFKISNYDTIKEKEIENIINGVKYIFILLK